MSCKWRSGGHVTSAYRHHRATFSQAASGRTAPSSFGKHVSLTFYLSLVELFFKPENVFRLMRKIMRHFLIAVEVGFG